ncbi:hypothetical protein [Peptacetobacter sp.]|uniref:hypothetical protein n=1 Tax=Peptacetobacter sp. TaxID=2991975 RepID=UPI002E7A2B13|nr:hypothetical protein [Peptacetobacter sp.]MEE0451118.1 hypothetical protein [Peptacetobacter sp.]
MKKIMTIGLALVTAISLVACKDSSQNNEAKKEPVNVVNENTEKIKFVCSEEISEEEQNFLREAMELIGLEKNDEVEIKVYKESGIDLKILKNGDKNNVKSIHLSDVNTDVEEGTYYIKMNDSKEKGSITIEKID